MKRLGPSIAIVLTTMASASLGAQPLYRETFESPKGGLTNYDGVNHVQWAGYFNKDGGIWGTERRHQEEFPSNGKPGNPGYAPPQEHFSLNSDIDATAPAPTANSYQTYSYPQPYDSFTMSIKVIWSKWVIGETALNSHSAEYQPNFHQVTQMVFDYNAYDTNDYVHALIYADPDGPGPQGNHWYMSADKVGPSTDVLGTGRDWKDESTVTFHPWARRTIDWTTTIWHQLDDNQDAWRTWDGYNPRVALNVDTSAFGKVQTFGFVNWETRDEFFLDNITLLPEPATLAMLFLGGIGLVGRHRN